jgi:hypothetical protein
MTTRNHHWLLSHCRLTFMQVLSCIVGKLNIELCRLRADACKVCSSVELHVALGLCLLEITILEPYM